MEGRKEGGGGSFWGVERGHKEHEWCAFYSCLWPPLLLFIVSIRGSYLQNPSRGRLSDGWWQEGRKGKEGRLDRGKGKFVVKGRDEEIKEKKDWIKRQIDRQKEGQLFFKGRDS